MIDEQLKQHEASWIEVRWWEHLLAVIIILVAIFYSVPCFFPSHPTLQLSANSASVEADKALIRRVSRLLESQQIAHQSIDLIDLASGRNRVEIHFADSNQRLRARGVIATALGSDYVTAFGSAVSIPSWLKGIGGASLKLGLDLRGGVHFLLQVDIQQALNQRLEGLQNEVRTLLQQQVVFAEMQSISTLPEQELINALEVRFVSIQDRDRAREVLNNQLGSYYQLKGSGDNLLILSIEQDAIRSIETAAVEQNLISLRNRVNELGVAEPLVQRHGRNRIVVELPGVQDTAKAKRVIGATANLEFRLEAQESMAAEQTIRLGYRDNSSQRARLERKIITTGSNVIDAQSGFDENGSSQVNIELDSDGGNAMGKVTASALGRRMGAVFIEYKIRQKTDSSGEISTTRYIEKSIISLATIQGVFANRFRITGLRDQYEAAELALLLRAGSLAAPVYFVEERTIGASLGEENIRLGAISMVIGLMLVAMFMLVFYRVCGLMAIGALVINTMLILAALATLSATLTLPGIAGLVLTLGMVVDANILIFARVAEELKRGGSPPYALETGFSRAITTILDANITTLLVAIILFAIGTGPVRGFAVTLSLGIVGSLISCIFMVRYWLKLTIGRSRTLSPIMLSV